MVPGTGDCVHESGFYFGVKLAATYITKTTVSTANSCNVRSGLVMHHSTGTGHVFLIPVQIL